jgi:hypothetical protein
VASADFRDQGTGGAGVRRFGACRCSLFISLRPIASKITVAAWKSKPSFYAVYKNDRTTAPELQRFVAERMKAATIEVDSSHVWLISHPFEMASLILQAAGYRAMP